MSTFFDALPSGIQQSGNGWLIYYGVAPLDIGKLPVNAEFTCVYSPMGSRAWRAVRFQVTPNHNFSIANERALEPDEISHFERLIAQYDAP